MLRTALTAGLAAIVLITPPIAVHAAPYVQKSREYYEARGDIIWEVPTNEKVIALTFDDGPDPDDTPLILDLLREYNARATFFVIGSRAEQYPDLVMREAAEGHEIANHTYSHTYFNKHISSEAIREEVRKAETVIRTVTGRSPELFRPPGGYYNDHLIEAMHGSGYQVVMWSWHQDTEDWRTPGVNKIVRKVLDNARNGDIILFHDHVHRKTQTIAALKHILPALRDKGFRFVTVSDLINYDRAHPVKK